RRAEALRDGGHQRADREQERENRRQGSPRRPWTRSGSWLHGSKPPGYGSDGCMGQRYGDRVADVNERTRETPRPGGHGVRQFPGVRVIRWLLRALELLRGDVPVDHVPDRLQVVRALVLVLQVVRVLPDVHADHRGLALAQRG